ncbi:hypothetical protein EDD18DRAFT_1359844 [Armillaria luteobubalina]|uniref:Uncharacterized protein n=1 Tax=Armillaria luteobubalina TaxID=153913 RepID=A0AA39UHV7_9AGAR|nr:hypothetical protein EDD18DRAFT_1359844 [Armillaria luteobubalina]
MADSPMLDILMSEGAVVVDADGNQDPSSSSSVAVPSQAIPDPISPGVSSSGTSLPRRGFSFRPQPLPAFTPVQVHPVASFLKGYQGTARVVEQSSYQTNRALEDLQAQIPHLQLSLSGDDDLATLKLRIASLETDISDLTQRLEETVTKGLQDRVCQEIKDIEEHAGLVVTEAAQKEADYCRQLADLNQDIDAAIQRDFDIRMEEKVKNVRLHVDVERRDLEKQSQDLEVTQTTFVEQRLQEKLAVLDRELEKRQRKLEKEAHDAHDVRVGSRSSEYHEKMEALSADIQAAQARRHAAVDAQAKAYNYVPEQMEVLMKEHYTMMTSVTQEASAAMQSVRDGNLADSTQGTERLLSAGEEEEANMDTAPDHEGQVTEAFPPLPSMSPEIGNEDAGFANERGQTNSPTSLPATLPATSNGATDQGNTEGSLSLKRRKAATARFHSMTSLGSSRSNSPSPSPAGSSRSSARDHQPGRHVRNTLATVPCVLDPAGERGHDSSAKGKEGYHSRGRPASSDGPRPNASDADSDESQPQPEQSATKDIPPEFFELMNRILKQQGPQLSSPVRDVEKKRAGPFKDHVSSRKHSPKEKWILKEVRRLCWKYLGIKHGPDIVLNGIGASPEEVAEYETGGPTPPINPMRPDWRSLKSRWNLDLAEAFYIQFCENADNPKEYEFSKNDILVAFENKLKYLRGHVFKATPLRDESSDQTQERLNASLKHRRDISRPTQRCLTLRDVRLEIAGNNMNLGDDRVDPGWRSVYEMLSLLGREGISSDESDAEGGPYIVKRRTWRSEELTQLLDIIDSSYDRKNIYGNARPGNRPHVRMRRRRATASERAPIRGLPLNFYDRDWYQLLTNVEKQLLRPEPEMELPAFAED